MAAKRTWLERQEIDRRKRVRAYKGPQHRADSGVRETVEEKIDYYLNGESRNMPFVAASIMMTKEDMARIGALLGLPAHAEDCTYDTPCDDCVKADNRSVVRSAAGRGGSILGKSDD